MNAADENKTAQGESGESEAQPTEQEMSGAAMEGGTQLSEEEIRILTNFVTETPEGEVENTAQAKRLAKQRARVEKHRGC